MPSSARPWASASPSGERSWSEKSSQCRLGAACTARRSVALGLGFVRVRVMVMVKVSVGVKVRVRVRVKV